MLSKVLLLLLLVLLSLLVLSLLFPAVFTIIGDSLSNEWLRTRVTEAMEEFPFEEVELEDEAGEGTMGSRLPLFSFSLSLPLDFEFEDLITGPYSHVTSESFDQFKSSGGIVFNPNLV